MSDKRTSLESSTDNQTNEDSDSFQQDENDKRAKLTSLRDTTLQDLPMELIQLILVKAVAMEVMDMTRKNNEWKEAAEPVISRLATVCSQWTSILTTDYFRSELHRTFDDEKTIRVEILKTFRFTEYVYEAIAFKDELFVVNQYMPPYPDNKYSIRVYDGNDVAEVKDIIPLPGMEMDDIAACNVSNCLYLLNNDAQNLSVLRVTKTDENKFNISPLISGMPRRYDTLSVAANGNLVLSGQQRKYKRRVISIITIYDPSGHLLRETWLSSDVNNLFYKVLPKSNGNLVLVSLNHQWETKLTEIDVDGTILRQYQSSLGASDVVCKADKYDRIVIVSGRDGTELLDSEMNLLEYSGPELDLWQFNRWSRMQYNRERNEIVAIVDLHVVVVFRFTEE